MKTDLIHQEWLSSQRSYSLSDLFRIFPEALTGLEKNWLKRQMLINEIEIEHLTEYIEQRLKAISTIKCQVMRFIAEEWLSITAGETTESLVRENKRIGWLVIPEAEKSDNRITDSMIKIAKEYPIENLIDVNRAGFALCPWHEDTKPSLYCKKNFVHCFACGNSGDSIALYQKLYDVGFREAVKALQ